MTIQSSHLKQNTQQHPFHLTQEGQDFYNTCAKIERNFIASAFLGITLFDTIPHSQDIILATCLAVNVREIYNSTISSTKKTGLIALQIVSAGIVSLSSRTYN